MKKMDYLALDLGAESGRAILGQFDGSKLELKPIHRFPNGPVKILDHLYWDVPRLWAEMKEGLAVYRREYKGELASIGLDTWGVDFALLGRNDVLLGMPFNYRDSRTAGMLEAAFVRVPREEVFAQTGIQFMEINTLYQLLAMRLTDDPLLDQAKTLLMIPDLFNYWFTGVKAAEFSIATTSQFYDPRRMDWAYPLLGKLGLPAHILPEVVQPGAVLGPLLPSVAEEVGLDKVQVIAPACHDTGSAVAAVPAAGDDFAYISSGTWSLMGVETRQPIINTDSLKYNFTNEGGVCGTFRLLKNIMGLWLVQQCRHTWQQAGEELSYAELTSLAEHAAPFEAVLDPDCPDFLRPGDMPTRIREYCRRTGQTAPGTKGEIVRCALESLALRYRWVIEKLELMLNRSLKTIHIVGGGCQNQLLCQLAADATRRTVIAGPVEATAAGNLIMQAISCGHIGSLAEGREVVRRSFEVTTYEPRSSAGWNEAYARFAELLGNE
ncbi:MAG: rhamnulokinase [Chloroflexi bacterium]|nr:rhamnulokinase [Chloroflexota bacterium]